MEIKQFIKKCIKKELIYKYNLYKNRKNSKKAIDVIREEISKKYENYFGRKIDWENPKTYTEKVNFSKLYKATKEKETLTDKILVRDWVSSKIGEQYLIPLLGVYDSFEQIDFDKLPNQFVIKCNHDSASTTIIRNKSLINKEKLKVKYDYLMKRNFAYVNYEMHYRNIKPQIVIEKLMTTDKDEEIKDYKFLCFHGVPYYCWVDFDRFKNHKRNIYDLDWNLQPFNQYHYGNYNAPFPKPQSFEEMLKLTQRLCQGFDHVRVDLYDVKGKVYFGEMTFTNGNGFEEITPVEWDYKLGDLWKLNLTKEGMH